jgi:hypothetical protein
LRPASAGRYAIVLPPARTAFTNEDSAASRSHEFLDISAGIALGSSSVNAQTRGEAEMTKYLAGVLTVIAAGVLLVAYGLLNPGTTLDARAAMTPAAPAGMLANPVAMQVPAYAAAPAFAYPAGAIVSYPQPQATYAPAAYAPVPVAYAQPAVLTQPAAPQPAQTVSYTPAPRRSATPRVEAQPKKDWKRAAMIIGGSSAAGAGVGAIFGGKKGALIGAAIGGGASTIYQTTR